ncbi:MAG TPA: penicillin-binding protein activator [Bradyrhizobium sp.]|nr:penicillin-binding protein activator [Bradyrhizobium sp.]
MKRWTIVSAMLLASAASASAEALKLVAPIKIGILTVLSGGAAGLGTDARDGMLFAIKQSGSKDVQVVVQDDQLKPEYAVQKAEQMFQSDGIDLLTGIVFSNVFMGVVPNVLSGGKIYISNQAGPSQFAGASCNQNLFVVSNENSFSAEVMASYFQKQGYKNVFLLAPNYPAGRDALEGFKRYYSGKYAGEVLTSLNQTDYASEIAQIRNANADAVFAFLPGGIGIAFIKQLRQAGVRVPLGSTVSEDMLGALGDSALGVISTAPWFPDVDSPYSKQFVKDFQAAYGRVPSVYAANGFDVMNLILAAASKANPKDTDAFRTALLKADFKSVRPSFKFNTNQFPVQDGYVSEIVKDGSKTATRIVDVAVKNHGDSLAKNCSLR